MEKVEEKNIERQLNKKIKSFYKKNFRNSPNINLIIFKHIRKLFYRIATSFILSEKLRKSLEIHKNKKTLNKNEIELLEFYYKIITEIYFCLDKALIPFEKVQSFKEIL